MDSKKNSIYKSISEVAYLLNLVNSSNGKPKTHTIRFWEKNFKQVKPKILTGRRRYYDDKTIEILKKIKYLLKDQGMTINGVKKYFLSKNTFTLDELNNNSINEKNKLLKSKVKKISGLIKEIKEIE